MAEQDIDLFGRKIFFINPAYTIKKDIISELQKEEYEIYIIENYRDTKNLLRRNPNSILFINIDAQLSVSGWFNFIRTLEQEESIGDTVVSVISERIKAGDVELFEKMAHLKGKVITFASGIEHVNSDIRSVLDISDAKGRRQYIRAKLMQDKESCIFWNHGTKMHQMKLIDISSVGMAVKVPPVLASQIIAKNFLLQNITIRLGLKQVVADAVVFAVKQAGDFTMWILLLLPQTSSQVKNEIRSYVTLTNTKELFLQLNSMEPDSTDYSLLNYYNLAIKHKSKV